MKLAHRTRQLAEHSLIKVVSARLESGHKLKIRFSDGRSRSIDFRPFLESSGNPLIRVFLDPRRFAQFAVRDGDLMWGDYEMCFPIADLYEGRI
jgi:hypothetical protein